MKKKSDEKALQKIVNLTKLIKKDDVTVEPKGAYRGSNKWRSANPQYAPKPEKAAAPEGLVNAGGMQVDPARAEEYENWRKDKIAEANDRRMQLKRKWDAARKARAAERNLPKNLNETKENDHDASH